MCDCWPEVDLMASGKRRLSGLLHGDWLRSERSIVGQKRRFPKVCCRWNNGVGYLGGTDVTGVFAKVSRGLRAY